MIDFLTQYYLWFKAFHLISLIAWMAGLLYLPRLFVYHCGVKPGSEASLTFKIMERRLLKIIMNPAMISTFIFGLILWSIPGIVTLSMGWFHLKILLVLVMACFHGIMVGWCRDFAADANQKSALFFRIANEVPTFLMIAIVILVVVKPF